MGWRRNQDDPPAPYCRCPSLFILPTADRLFLNELLADPCGHYFVWPRPRKPFSLSCSSLISPFTEVPCRISFGKKVLLLDQLLFKVYKHSSVVLSIIISF